MEQLVTTYNFFFGEKKPLKIWQHFIVDRERTEWLLGLQTERDSGDYYFPANNYEKTTYKRPCLSLILWLAISFTFKFQDYPAFDSSIIMGSIVRSINSVIHSDGFICLTGLQPILFEEKRKSGTHNLPWKLWWTRRAGLLPGINTARYFYHKMYLLSLSFF